MSEMTLADSTIKILKATAPAVRANGLAITSTMYRIMTTNHPEVKNLFNTSHIRPGPNGEPPIQAHSLANAVIGYAENCDQLGNLSSAVDQMVHKHVSFKILPEHYPIVGKSILAAIKEVLGDAATDEVMEGWEQGYNFLADLLINAEKNLYDELASKPGGWNGYRALKVVKKEAESSNVTSFYFSPPDDEPLIDYTPGQFLSFCIPKEEFDSEHNHVRNYSISNRPGTGQFRISVKKEVDPEHGDGIISNYFHDKVEEGSEVLVGPPCGTFVLDTSSEAPIVLIAGGVGLTPLMSMLEQVRESQPERDVTFILSAKDSEQHPFAAQVDEIAGASNVQYHVLFTGDNAEMPGDLDHLNSYMAGRLTKERLEEIVGEQAASAEFYFCGPTPFMDAVKSMLLELEVDPARIKYEYFGPTVS